MSLIRIEIDFKKFFVKILINKIILIVISDKVKDCKFGFFVLLFIFFIVIGINVKLIVVIIDFVIIGGKKFVILEKMLVIKMIYIFEVIKVLNI